MASSQVVELNKGFTKAKKLINGAIINALYEMAEAYLRDMVAQKGYMGFTGNTQTSYCCGIYKDGALDRIVYQKAWNAQPVRKKVKKNKLVFLKDPYEGKERSVRGMVTVDNRYGQERAIYLLQRYKKVARTGWTLVLTTGTEYSEYIEQTTDRNVMSNTWVVAGSIALNKLTKIRV